MEKECKGNIERKKQIKNMGIFWRVERDTYFTRKYKDREETSKLKIQEVMKDEMEA